MRHPRIAALCFVSAALLPGCNSGLAAIFGSADNGTADSPSTITAFAVEGRQESPATLRFRVIDANGDAATVSLFYQVPGAGSTLMTQLGGATNPKAYGGSAGGTEYTLSWDFANEPGFAAGAGYTQGVNVWAQIDGTSSIVLGANASQVGLGNDAPVVDEIRTPTGEGSGVIPIGLDLSDSSDDLVKLRVEWQVVGESQWHLARPGGERTTPAYAITGLSAPATGASLNFFWDTNADLPQLERDVQLRMTPVDPVEEGDPFLSEVFRVDNNQAPLIDLDNGLVVYGNDDRVGGIAIPFTVRDAEGDDLRVVFQWRTVEGDFPALPSDPAEVFAIQADPALRAQYQVCSTRRSWVGGRAMPVGNADRVRLPELGTSRAPLSRNLYAGRPLEILRHAELPVELAASWSTNSLTQVVAAVPIGDGLDALVLEEPGSASWRVRRVTLATGAIVGAELASGSGVPTALALDAREQALFIGSLQGGWRLQRLDLETLELSAPATGPTVSPDGLRGIAALSSAEAVASVDDGLVRVRFPLGSPVVSGVVAGLAQPWGVARDPFSANSVLVAEHGADRVVRVDTRARTWSDVLQPDPSSAPAERQRRFPAPRAVAVDRGGERLLVVTDDAGTRELRALNRYAAYDQDESGFADATTHVLFELPSAAGDNLAVGADGLRLLAIPGTDQLIGVGGVEQRRVIEEVEAGSNVVRFSAPLDPPLTASLRWRVPRSGLYYGSSASGAQHTFAWDSRDLPRGGSVLFRAVPFDSEFGVDSQTSVERPVDSAFGVRRIGIATSSPSQRPVQSAIDYDGDGDLDVVLRELTQLSVYVQEGPGRFASDPVVLDLNFGESNGLPLLYHDLDGDGFLDIVHCAVRRLGPEPPELADKAPDRWKRVVEFFYGTGPGTFEAEPVRIELDDLMYKSIVDFGQLSALDYDGDGVPDLVMTRPACLKRDAVPRNYEGILVMRCTGPRSYAPAELVAEVLDEEIWAATTGFAYDDIDGDGRMDFACAQNGVAAGSRAFGAISLHFQDRNGSYDEDVVLLGDVDPIGPLGGGNLSTGGVRTISLVDLDADGDLDVVAGMGSASSLGWNLILPTEVGRTLIYFQESPRVFSSEPVRLRPSQLSGILSFVAGTCIEDLNGDGMLDIVSLADVGVVVHFAKAPGTFDPVPLVFPTSTNFNEYQREFAPMQPCDLDGDGDLDVLGQDLMNGSIFALLQVGAGIESLSDDPKLIELEGYTNGATDPEVGDLDSDGDFDLVVSNSGLGGTFGTNTLTLFTQIAPRTFVSIPAELPIDGSMVEPGPVTLADLDFDGDNEVVALSVRTNEVQVFFQEAPGQFGEALKLAGPVAPYAPNPSYDSLGSLLVADADLDGDLDLLATPNRSNRLAIFEQESAGVFSALPTWDQWLEPGVYASTSPRRIVAADLDRDGVLELLYVAGSQNLYDDPETKRVETYPEVNQVLVYEGGGSLDPKAGLSVIEPGGDSELVVDDIDGDGILDLATIGVEEPGVTGSPRVMRINYGTPEGGYELQVLPIPGPDIATSAMRKLAELVDFDADGDLDLAVMTGGSIFGPSTLHFYEQLAPRVFAREPLLEGPGGNSMRVEDVDGDGELDATVAHYTFPLGGRTWISWGNR